MAKKQAQAPVNSSPELQPRRIQGFGWLPDLPDQRDFLYAAPAPFQGDIPSKVDLRAQCPEVYDQGALGSCTANAIGGAIEFDQLKQKLPPFIPSRLFIYYNERVIEGTVSQDAGAQIRDGIKSVAKLGAPPESDWTYDIQQFAVKPSKKAYVDAAKHLVVTYQRLVQEVNTMHGCLASGYPFVFGFTCYESLESPEVAKTGVLPMPHATDKPIGGHAVVCVGYDDDQRVFFVRNSWSATWGQSGYFTMPYAYLTSTRLASDLWTIRSVA